MRLMDDWLGSEETGGEFTHCMCCRFPLLEIAMPWLVNKEYHREECVLEYAICQGCRDQMTDRFSEESKEAARQFLEHEIDWEERVKEFMLAHNEVERFDACIACCTPRGAMEGFGISAIFDSGGKIVTGPLPLLICRSCIDRMSERLSATSREVWRDFLGEYFTGPASDSEFPGLF